MTPQETKKIVCAFVDYGWPVQGYFYIKADSDEQRWLDEPEMTVEKLCGMIFQGVPVRLDPNHPHDWAIEQREGYPCWRREHWTEERMNGPFTQWRKDRIGEPYLRSFTQDRTEVVAPHPLHSDQPPPEDWTAEGRRILK